MIAIAGAAGGLGPVVARRLAEAGATLALTDVDPGRLDALVAGLGLPEERVDTRVVDLLAEDGARDWAGASPSGSAASTACCTWSAAGGAASRSPALRSPTTNGCTTCSCAPVQHATRAFHDATRSRTGASSSSPPPRRRRPSGTNAAYAAAKAAAEPGPWPSPTRCARRVGARPRTSSSSTRSSPRRCGGEPRQAVQDLHLGRGHRRGDRLPALRRGGEDEPQARLEPRH